MKKLKLFAVWALTICSLCFMMVSCGKKGLSSPTGVAVDDTNTLTWSVVEQARRYMVEISFGGESKINSTKEESYSLSDLKEGDYEIRIKAIGDGKELGDSEWSAVLYFHKDYETGCVYTLINNDTEFEITNVGFASGKVVLEDAYKKKPVTRIAEAAFKGNNNVESVVIGNNVSYIGANAFYNCSKLSSITIPDSVTYIGEAAFHSCRELKSVSLPQNLEYVSPYTFSYCKGLESVTLGSGTVGLGEAAFSDCSSLKQIVFPDSLKEIGEGAFSADVSLVSATFGSGTESIGKNAFSKCFSLANLNFAQESSLTEIGELAFSYCNVLSSAILPEGVTDVGDFAFYKAEQLNEVTIPKSVTHIGANAFGYTKFYLEAIASSEPFVYAGNWVVGCSSDYKDTIAEITATTFKSGVVGIADTVFANCKILEKVAFATSLKVIGKYAFYNNSSLWRIDIPAQSVERIGEKAFANCKILTRLYLGEGVKTIERYAFYNCTSLDNNSLEGSSLIPQSVTSIGTDAFKATKMWENPDEVGVVRAGKWVVGFNGENISSITLNKDTVGIADYSFFNCASLKAINGLGNAKYVGRGAFYGCTALASVSLGSNLKEIEAYTFFNCTSLFRVSFPTNLSAIGEYAFSGCKNLNELDLSESSVKTIGKYAFFGCSNMKEVALGSELESIGKYSFSGCSSITTLNIPDSVVNIAERAYANCTALESVTVGAGVLSIEKYAFAFCSALKTVKISDSVKTLGNYAFYNCPEIENLDLGGVETIGNYAFYGASKLSFATIPDSVKRIGDYAFKDCVNLAYLKPGKNLEKIGVHAFYGCSAMSVYTDAEKDPAAWNAFWNSSYRPVVRGCTFSEDGSYVVSVTVDENTIDNVHARGGISAPYRAGYAFKGWATEKDSSVAVYEASMIAAAPLGSVLYAVWSKI